MCIKQVNDKIYLLYFSILGGSYGIPTLLLVND